MSANHIAKSLFIVTNKFKRYLDKMNQSFLMSQGQSRILRYLYLHQFDNIIQKDIENEFQIRGASISGLIDGLVKLEFVYRIDDPNDRRKNFLRISPKGLEIAEKSSLFIENFEEQLESLLTEDELTNFRVVIDKLNDYIDKKEKPDDV